MRANIEGDAQLVLESLRAEPIRAGNSMEYETYPKKFAEGEAWDVLCEAMETVHEDTIEKADAKLQIVIADLIMFGKFEGIEKL